MPLNAPRILHVVLCVIWSWGVDHAAAQGKAWLNSMGMKFVPAGTANVQFCVYDVRVKDYQAFVDASGYAAGDTWKNPGFSQEPDHPVVGVSWIDAKAFCKWLTDKEHESTALKSEQSYRLPTDLEWTAAVGLVENSEGTPASKSGKVQSVYPWGTSYPPPADAGNYCRQGDGAPYSDRSDIPGTDGYAYTSPVGSFAANKYGLYDMGGNVWQWCEDWYSEQQKRRVLRGGSRSNGLELGLRSSYRSFLEPDFRGSGYGFRIVLVSGQ